MSQIEEIQSKIDIVDLVSMYVPDLKKAGANFRAKCPFHTEKTPSFMVSPQLQIFKCFGCGKAGNIFKFIEEIEKVDFKESLQILAKIAGVDLQQYSFNKKDEKKEKEKQSLLEANALTAQYYHYIFLNHKSGEKGRLYAQKRKIDKKTAEKFLIGFSGNAKFNLKRFLLKKGYNEKDLVKWGLLVERDGIAIDKFRNRLIQPIFDLKGNVVGFSGRYIGKSKDAPKYLNSPETLVYKKNEILYGLFHAKEEMRKKGFVILEEGNIDILSSHRVGVGNIVAPLGTAFTESQARLLKRFVDEVYFCFDTDDAGVKALIRAIEICENIGIKNKVIDIIGYQDPDDLICKNPKEWGKRIKKAVDSIEYLFSLFSKKFDLDTAFGKSDFAKFLSPVLMSIKDELRISHYYKELSTMLEVPVSDIKTFIESRGKIKKLIKKTEVKLESNFEDIESFYLSLLLQFKKKPSKHIQVDFISSPLIKTLFKNIFFNEIKLLDGIKEDHKKILENIILKDLSFIKKPKEEILKVEKKIELNFLKKEIMRIRTLLSKEPSNKENLKRLDKCVKRIREIN